MSERLSRRRTLGAGAAILISCIGGCFRTTGAMLGEESDCFKSVKYHAGIGLGADTIAVTLEDGCDADYVLAIDNGDQIGRGAVGTGETHTEVNVDGRTGDVEIVAVEGGQISNGSHVGGTVIARAAVEVKDNGL